MIKRFLTGILSVASLLLLVSCSATNVKEANEKVFTSDGMHITLTEGFKEKEMEGYTACYDSPEIAVFTLKETGDNITTMTVLDYAQLVLSANASKSPKNIETIDGIPSMEYTYTNETTNVEYQYLTFMYKAADAFWLVQFTCKTEDYEADKPYFINWAKTVTFDNVTE